MADNPRSVMSGSGTTKWTMLGLAATLAVCFIGVVHGQAVVTRPELLSGPWEVASPSGVDGIFVKIATHAQGPIDRQTIRSQTVQVRVYHRKDGHETGGWYVVSPPRYAAAEFDGRRLRVGGLTATFDQDAARWTGTWALDGQTREVVLERPRPAKGVTLNPLCGDWEGLPDTIPALASTRLHTVQSSDGALAGWMDRMIAVIDQRYGESLTVISADPSSVILGLESPGGRPYRFSGVLSYDGNSITGH